MNKRRMHLLVTLVILLSIFLSMSSFAKASQEDYAAEPTVVYDRQSGEPGGVTVQELVPVEEEETPLAAGMDRRQTNCMLHFVIFILALLIELIYISDRRERQEKILRLRRELLLTEMESRYKAL